MDTGEIVNKYYEFANRGDWTSWVNLFARDQVMDEQLAGHIEGQQKLRELMAGFPAMYKSFQNLPQHIIVSGEEAAVFSHISARTSAGEPIEADVVNYFRVVQGQIVYMRNIHDTAAFRAVLAGSDGTGA